jgi:hypothetical protein
MIYFLVAGGSIGGNVGEYRYGGRLVHYRKRHDLSQHQQEKNFSFLAQVKYFQQHKISYISRVT